MPKPTLISTGSAYDVDDARGLQTGQYAIRETAVAERAQRQSCRSPSGLESTMPRKRVRRGRRCSTSISCDYSCCDWGALNGKLSPAASVRGCSANIYIYIRNVAVRLVCKPARSLLLHRRRRRAILRPDFGEPAVDVVAARRTRRPPVGGKAGQRTGIAFDPEAMLFAAFPRGGRLRRLDIHSEE